MPKYKERKKEEEKKKKKKGERKRENWIHFINFSLTCD